ncbi:MAG: Flagellar protein [Caldanaerobacter subterraneus]|uniref:Flagellar hook protein FlgE n=1 Tax=Caldanaerobacter subterraneus TaxID=911092 RepID=A0A101E7I8_9THEO|nr:flagellar basal-body rod protein FlgF [Caldanaerobacter subterraneus]KUK09872.1 MAG: Flagellar protein [Caldanaerobacter subterraneus]TCO67791.1 flagellar hook protein FlgE [Caldanaerobacter subterraneus]HBT49415.1 flagellar basal-body rod protein FlgF [Caldanaerobacter subterraneus]
MLRSMYSAISGLQAHQAKLDVIGNNIANVNTVGYKASRMTFKEIFSQTIKGASAPQGNGGGTNPQQIGLGVAIASIDTLFTRGGAQRTDNPTDLSIDGNGFFIVSNGESILYTRAGNFSFDSNGDLVTPDGYKVLGWMSTDGKTVNTDTGNLVPINLKNWFGMEPSTTTQLEIGGNLNASTGINQSISYNIIVYDTQGGSHVATITFTRQDPNTWNWSVTSQDPYISSVDGSGTITFGADGKIAPNTQATGTLTFNMNTAVTNAQIGPVNIDLSKLTMFSTETNLRELSKNGNEAGALQSINIDKYGVVSGIYSNGRRQVIGQIALADFQNPMGLEKVGNTMFINTVNSGEPMIGAAGSGTRGSINPGTLEMSNVNLANEFVDMITTQRGFQANAKVITVSDEMLQDLVNMKR